VIWVIVESRIVGLSRPETYYGILDSLVSGRYTVCLDFGDLSQKNLKSIIHSIHRIQRYTIFIVESPLMDSGVMVGFGC